MKYKFKAERIYNIDETGITTVLQSPKIIAESKKRQVGQIVSGERGELVTFCGIVSASGNSLPPVFVFPRVKFKDAFLNEAPVSSVGLVSRTGWMIAPLFVDVLKHITQQTNCDSTHPILLLLDNHISHTSIEAISYAKENGIIVLSFPPHCSHRLQQLDVGVYGPFKSSLKIAFNDFMASNPGKTITIYNIASLSRTPFLSAFSMRNIQSSFAKTGIWPLNSMIFTDEDFESSYATDRQDPSTTTEEILGPNEVVIDDLTDNFESQVAVGADVLGTKDFVEYVTDLSSVQLDSIVVPSDCVARPPGIQLELIRPFPKAGPKKTNNKRIRNKSTIYTDTPEKKKLEERHLQKEKSVKKVKKYKEVLQKVKSTKKIRKSKEDLQVT